MEQTPPLGRHPPSGQTPLLWSDPSPARPPWPDTRPQQTATAADGTHPAGMHSCVYEKSQILKINIMAVWEIFCMTIVNWSVSCGVLPEI